MKGAGWRGGWGARGEERPTAPPSVGLLRTKDAFLQETSTAGWRNGWRAGKPGPGRDEGLPEAWSPWGSPRVPNALLAWAESPEDPVWTEGLRFLRGRHSGPVVSSAQAA